MYTLRQYKASWRGERMEYKFNTIEEMENLPWVRSFKEKNNAKRPFFRFSLNTIQKEYYNPELFLMAEYKEGVSWDCVGEIFGSFPVKLLPVFRPRLISEEDYRKKSVKRKMQEEKMNHKNYSYEVIEGEEYYV